jgi:Tol biopolymer transport system component
MAMGTGRLSRESRARVVAGGTGVIVCAALVVVGPPTTSQAAAGPTTTRVSVMSSGQERFKDSYSPQISKSGRWVAFESEAKLVPFDTNGFRDIYLRDRQTGKTTLVSVAAGGGASVGSSVNPSMTPDGRYIAFETFADDVVPGDDNDNEDIVVRDMVTGTTELASLTSDGSQTVGANNWSTTPSISEDGRYVAFVSVSPYFVPGDYDGTADVFVRDRQAGTTDIVSLTSTGGFSQGGENFGPASISADGRFVAFYSRATNLVANDTNDTTDVFLRDRSLQTTVRASVGPGGVQANGGSGQPALSGNGKFLAFQSGATNLLGSPTDSSLGDIYVRDLAAGTNELASVTTTGTGAGSCAFPAMSHSGRFVVFESLASTLVPSDTNLGFDVFVRDVVSDTTRRVSVSTGGVEGNSSSGVRSVSAISSNGQHVAFDSRASNLVPNDKNGVLDVFVRLNWAS